MSIATRLSHKTSIFTDFDTLNEIYAQLKRGLHMVITIAEHVCNDDSVKNLKLS